MKDINCVIALSSEISFEKNKINKLQRKKIIKKLEFEWGGEGI